MSHNLNSFTGGLNKRVFWGTIIGDIKGDTDTRSLDPKPYTNGHLGGQTLNPTSLTLNRVLRL